MDPNPLAQKREAHRLEEQAAEAVRRALPADFVAELEGRDPEARKRKKIEGSFGLDGYEPSDEIWYARTREIEGSEDTSHQIESSRQPLLIENAPAQDLASTIGGQQSESSGILSSSTLAAARVCPIFLFPVLHKASHLLWCEQPLCETEDRDFYWFFQ